MFTSKLPKSTSARRPSNPNDGSTSMFGTQIPVSVRKANLFTPQPKRSLQTGLSSTTRKSYSNTDKKYQKTSKPAPDRDEQIRMFETLVEFLRRNAPGFPIPETKRFLTSVSTTEATRLFECLIGNVIPDFKINKLDVDVPEALALLEYPYIRSVTKSALVSITTRQAIGNLLVIFNWLIEFIEIANSGMNDAGEQQSPRVKILFNILDNPNQAMQSEAECAQIELERIKDQKGKLEELSNLIDDLEKSEKYNEKLSKIKESVEDKLKKIDEECAELSEQLLMKEEETKSLGPFETLEADQHAQRSEIDHLEKMIKSEEKALEVALHNARVKLTEIRTDKQNEEKEFAREMKVLETRETKLKKLLEYEINNLELEKRRCTEEEELNMEILRNTLDRNKQEALRIVKDVEQDRDKWGETAAIVKENLKTAKRFSRKLDKLL